MLLSVVPWSGERVGLGVSGDIEVVMLPEFYEELKHQSEDTPLSRPIDFCNLTKVNRVVRKESPDDPMSVVVFKDDQGSAVEDAYHDAVFVLDKDERTLRVVNPLDVIEGDEVFDFNENPDDVPEPTQWVLTDKIGLIKNRSARMRLAVFGGYFLVALFDGALQVHVNVDDEYDITLYAPDPYDYDPNEVIDPDDVVWYMPATLPDRPYAEKGHHGFFNIQYTYYKGASMNACIGPWLSENAEGKNVIETIMLPEFYNALKQSSEGNTPPVLGYFSIA